MICKIVWYNESMRRRGKKQHNLLLLILIFLVTVAIVIGASLLFSGKLPFKPGEITYDASLTPAEQAFIANAVEEVKLDNDVMVSAETMLQRPEGEDTLVYDILVPVTDYYDVRSDIASDAEDLKLISINDLASTDKLLALDGNYFFDDIDKGAKFRVLKFDGKNPAELKNILQTEIKLPEQSEILSINQTGVTALTRGMLKVLKQQGSATYFAEKIADFLKNADYTHISNEVSFADGCTVDSGSTTLCADWQMLDVIKAIGTDIVELTGNHNNDYGSDNNLATIAKYQGLGLKTFGGGMDEESASVPLTINDKGAKITLLGYNQSTSTKANGQGADGDYPGANIYDAETAKAQIAEAKARGDFVIVDVQYFECYSYPDEGEEYPTCDSPISGQEEFFKDLIDMGADMVVGTQAHQPQTFELYKGKPIFYGLGNLFFDQIYWPGTTRSYILTHYFRNGEYIQTRITPTVYDETLQTSLMDEENSQWFLDRLNAARVE